MKINCLVALSLFSGSAFGNQIDPRFFKALNLVETGGRSGAILGDQGKALGPYQIHKAYWKDVSKQVGGSYSDVVSRSYSEKVILAYLNKYASDAVAHNDFETLSRIHNGGAKGATKEATKGYWEKVKKKINKLK